jgi:hypothetical protein
MEAQGIAVAEAVGLPFVLKRECFCCPIEQ